MNELDIPNKEVLIPHVSDLPGADCKVKGCKNRVMAGHGGMCVYHWRNKEKLPCKKLG